MELLALRDLSTDLAGWGSITPIIEPVMSNPGDLRRCVQALQGVQAPLYLILNPNQGQLNTETARGEWRQAIGPLVEDPNGVTYPSHQVSTTAEAAALPAFLGQFSDRRVGIVLRQPHVAALQLAELIADRRAIVFVHASSNPRDYLRRLPADKCVEVVSSFNAQSRNADYEAAEWFTSSHVQFAEEGRPGFSDFGPLPPTFSLSGGQAGAVAIHLGFPADDNALWMDHFVSDTVERGEGDAASKIAEAVAKIRAEVEREPDKFVSSPGLQAFLDDRVLDLGTNKRQQLVHHLATIAVALGNAGAPTNLD